MFTHWIKAVSAQTLRLLYSPLHQSVVLLIRVVDLLKSPPLRLKMKINPSTNVILLTATTFLPPTETLAPRRLYYPVAPTTNLNLLFLRGPTPP